MASEHEPEKTSLSWRGFALTRDVTGTLILLAAFSLVWHRSGRVEVQANVSGPPAAPERPNGSSTPVSVESSKLQTSTSIYDATPPVTDRSEPAGPVVSLPEPRPRVPDTPVPPPDRPRVARRRAPATNTPPPPPATDSYKQVFDDVKLVTVDGRSAHEQDAVLTLVSDGLTLESEKTGRPLASMPYAAIERATASFGPQPQWSHALPRPGDEFRVGRGLLRRRRHWLVLQGREGFLIARLDGRNWRDILAALEVRGRLTISMMEQE